MDSKFVDVPLEVIELKASDGGHEFTAYASTFGNVDQGGDVVMRGAFDATLGKRARRPLLWQHHIDVPIGVEKSIKVDDRGLIGTWRLLKSAPGQEAYEALKEGAVDGMSIGYVADDVQFDDVGTRLLKSIDLLECSVVTLPMNEQATVTRVKAKHPQGLDLDVPFEDLLAQLKGFLLLGTDEAEALQARRAADERKLSDAHTSAIDAFLLEVKACAGRLESLLASPVEAEALPSGGNWKSRIALARTLSARRVQEARW